MKKLYFSLLLLSIVFLSWCVQHQSIAITQSSQDVVAYVNALNNVFYKLYHSTTVYNELANQYPSFSQETINMTTSLQVSKDLTEALSFLEPFILDKNESIKITAGLFYLDILDNLNANNTVAEFYSNVSPDNIKTLQYSIANLVSTQKTLKDDLFNNILPLIKGIIQIPVDDKERIGFIKYSITKDQRLSLLENIDRIFGDDMKNSEDNIYLLMERVIQLSLTPDTYEEQAVLSF